MKRVASWVARAAALALLVASGAVQAGGHALTINASVLGACRFAAATSTLAFVLDPLGSGTVSQTANVVYQCSKGNAGSTVLQSASTGSGTGGNLRNAADTVPYAVSTTLSGNGNGKPRTLSVTVTISQPAAANVRPGTYTDTIAITLTP
jgi:spore coat protein U-like protein